MDGRPGGSAVAAEEPSTSREASSPAAFSPSASVWGGAFEVLDATQLIQEGHPRWPGRPCFARTVAATVERDGFCKYNFT
jgi:hypothetical protein